MRENGAYQNLWKANVLRQKCASLIEDYGFKFLKLEDFWNTFTEAGGVDIAFIASYPGGGKKVIHVNVNLDAREQSRLTPSAENKILEELESKLKEKAPQKPQRGVLAAKR